MPDGCRYYVASLIAVLGVVMLWASPAGAQSPSEVNWIDGNDQYEVALAALGGECVGLAAADGSAELALATGENWPDALAASALDRPLLLTGRASLHPGTRRFVDGCPGAVDIVILGGTSAISQAVEDELVALGASVQRIAGADRCETALKIAEFAVPGRVELVYLATGANFADAIAAAPRITASSPIVLTPKAALGAHASTFLSSRLASNGQVVILGGTAAVSGATEADVRSLGLHPRRIAGSDRYATSALIATESLRDPDCAAVESIVVASGTDPYGGLVAASVRGPCQPMLLAPPPTQAVASSLTAYLQAWSSTLEAEDGAPCRVTMVGSRSTLGSQILDLSTSALEAAGCSPQSDERTPGDERTPADEAFRDDYVRVADSDRLASDAYGWWRQPHGDITVHVHLCVGKGLKHYFARRDLESIATSYNSDIAPFYSWQSSGLVRVTFKPGDIIVSNDLTPGLHLGLHGIFVPPDCLAPYEPEPAVAHAFLVYGERLQLGSDGLGELGGPFSTSYIIHDPAEPDPGRRSFTTDRATFVAQHEFDHNLGAPHHNGDPFGFIRWFTHSSASEHVGSLQGYPDIDRLRQQSPGSPTRYSVFPCYVLSSLGWPVGDGHPACARIAPPPPQNVKFDLLGDKGVRLTWDPPSTDINPAPPTGYEIRLLKWSRVNGSLRSGTVVETYSVGADVTSFTVPAQNADRTEYFLEIRASSAVGLGDRARATGSGAAGGSADSFVFVPDAGVTVAYRLLDDGSISAELSWTAAPGATSYQVTGDERCQFEKSEDGGFSGCSHVVREPRYVLSERLGQLVAGKSYNIEIFACNDHADIPESDRCFPYAIATVDLRNLSTTTLHLEVDPPVQLGDYPLVYRVEWAPASQLWAPESQAVEYQVWAALCAEDQGPCMGILQVLQGSDYRSASDKSTARLDLDRGERYWISLRACPPLSPEDGGFFRPHKCPILAETWITVPTRSG